MIKWCCVKSSPWDAVVLIHGAHSREYDDIDPLIKTTFAEATTDWWAELSKTHNGGAICCIVDDTNMADLDRKERSNLFALYQHVATHCCVTVLCAAHSWTQLIPRVRRGCDVVCRSECSSVPVRRRPRRIALKTCANEVSGDYRFCILEHSPAQRVFQPVPAFQRGGQAGR